MSIVINDVSPRVHYAATPGQTVFQVPFEFLRNADLRVYVNEALAIFSAPAAAADQYSTTGEGQSGGGTITFGPPGRQINDQVVIYRDMPIARSTDLPTSGVFPVAALNDDFDKTTAMIQQTEVNVEQRALRMKPFDFMETMNALPTLEGRRGRLLGFDLNGQPVLVKPSELGLIVGSGGEDTGTSFLGLIWTDDAPPPVPWKDGQLWWKASTGQLMLYYTDVNSSQWVQINIGTGTMAAGPLPPSANVRIVSRIFNLGAGSWTKPSGCRFYRLRGTGGGGGGGGAHTTTNTIGSGGGGGSGGYGETAWLDASGVSGASWQVGAGGNGGLGAAAGTAGAATIWNDGVNTLNCLGGQPGTSHPGLTGEYVRRGGSPGSVNGNFLIRSGNAGEAGHSSSVNLFGGGGGGNQLGQGALSIYGGGANVVGNNAAIGYGGGGGGCFRTSGVTGDTAGGNGAPGVLYVEEMY